MAIRYVPYYPDPIDGQAVLDNFVRTRRILRYRDNNRVYDRMQRGMPFYELEKIESIGKNDGNNMLIRGECLSACAYLKENNIAVDLVYIDPPFASGADYAKTVYIRKNPHIAEKIREVEQTLDIEELKAFEEKMYGDIWNKEAYLNWIYENLCAIKSVMSENASIFMHLDWHIGHYVKILMDEIFGEENFINEIIWYYPDNFQGNVQGFATNHNNIFWYAKSSNYVSNKVMISLGKTVKRDKRIWSKELGKLISARNEDGNLIYEDYNEKKADDVWTIGQSSTTKANSGEYIDYNTQKPEELLRRIIEVSSNKDMVVADFFGGSGVTAAVAHRLGRRFIHVDVGINSIQTTRDRLIENKAQLDIYDIKDGVSLFRNPVQTMEKLKGLISGLKNEDSLDKFWEGAISDSKLGMIPVYLPNLMDGTTRILDKVLISRILNEAMPHLPEGIKKVIVYYTDIDDEKAVINFIKEFNIFDIEIELRDLKQVLDNVVAQDYAEMELQNEQEGMFTYSVVEIKRFFSDRLNMKISEFNEKGYLSVLNLPENGKEKRFSPITISETGLELIEYISLDCTNNESVWISECEVKIDKSGYIIINGKKSKDFWDGKIRTEKKPLRIKIRNISGDETVFPL